MRQNLATPLLEMLARGRRVDKQPLKSGIVKPVDQPHDTVVLVGARQAKRTAVLVEDGIESIGGLALAGQALQPDSVGDQKVIEGPIHAPEEGTHIPSVGFLIQRQGGLVKPGVGPAIVSCQLGERRQHDRFPVKRLRSG
jgi:hypothetical protein